MGIWRSAPIISHCSLLISHLARSAFNLWVKREEISRYQVATFQTILSQKHSEQMKKYILIEEDALERLLGGEYVQGSLHYDKTCGLTFNAYAKRRKRTADELVRTMEHGWLKETTTRIKLFESIPKSLGTHRVMSVLDREVHEVKGALIDREIINLV